jgi:hypothetical protein
MPSRYRFSIVVYALIPGIRSLRSLRGTWAEYVFGWTLPPFKGTLALCIPYALFHSELRTSVQRSIAFQIGYSDFGTFAEKKRN